MTFTHSPAATGVDPATFDDPAAVFEAILDPQRRGELYPLLHRMRELEPLHGTDVLWGRPGWIISSFADAHTVLTNPRMDSDARNAEIFNIGPSGEGFFDMLKRMLLFIGSEEHIRLRRLLSPFFLPRAIKGNRTLIQTVVDELLDNVEQGQTIDMVEDLAYALPTRIICEILGVDSDEMPIFHQWLNDFARRGDLSGLTPEVIQKGEDATQGFTEFFTAKIAQRRKQPRDDLISKLIATEDKQGSLADDQLVPIFTLMIQAGHETTADMTSLATLALLRHPDQLDLLRHEPGRIVSALEELCRYEGSNQLVQRVADEDFELNGTHIAAGEVCGILTGAAARDPARYTNPDKLDFSRQDIQHFAFGHGRHICLGAHLARAEMQAMLGSLIQRFPDFELAEESIDYREGFVLRGLKRLRIKL